MHQKFRPDLVGDDALWVRTRGDDAYRPFGPDEAAELRARMDGFGRARFWDL